MRLRFTLYFKRAVFLARNICREERPSIINQRKIIYWEKSFISVAGRENIRNNYTFSEPFYTGGQPDDDRIIVQESTVHAPYYTEGESFWRKSTIIIDGVRREDDGLYECQAENEGGRFYKSGHITVHFGPTFEDQLYDKEWSWDQRPIKLSCIGR